MLGGFNYDYRVLGKLATERFCIRPFYLGMRIVGRSRAMIDIEAE